MSLERKKRQGIVILLFFESICYLSVFLSSSIFPRSSNRVHNHRETASLHCRLVTTFRFFADDFFYRRIQLDSRSRSPSTDWRGWKKTSCRVLFNSEYIPKKKKKEKKKKKKIINASLFRVYREIDREEITLEIWISRI